MWSNLWRFCRLFIDITSQDEGPGVRHINSVSLMPVNYTSCPGKLSWTSDDFVCDFIWKSNRRHDVSSLSLCEGVEALRDIQSVGHWCFWGFLNKGRCEFLMHWFFVLYFWFKFSLFSKHFDLKTWFWLNELQVLSLWWIMW